MNWDGRLELSWDGLHRCFWPSVMGTPGLVMENTEFWSNILRVQGWLPLPAGTGAAGNIPKAALGNKLGHS